MSSDESGKLSGDTLKHMIDLADAGKIDGICFAPLNKGAMNRGGWKYPDEHQMFAALTKHKGFFGEMNVIKEFSTFRVTAKRADKRLPLTSMDAERIVGAAVYEQMGKAVSLRNPDLTVYLELLSRDVYFSVEKIPGPGGMPVGVIANQPLALAGTLDIPASQKAARFVAMCDAFEELNLKREVFLRPFVTGRFGLAQGDHESTHLVHRHSGK